MSARNFLIVSFVVLVVFSLTFTTILNTNTNTNLGIDAFAKKNSKTFSNMNSNVTNGVSGSDRGDNSKTRNSILQGSQATISGTSTNNNINNDNGDKFVILNFDDSHQSDYTYAKPILDKYGFKATFFEVCNWVEAGYHDKDISITWPEITALQQDGMDIEAHTMTHPILNDLSQSDLNYEIGQSKQCLENHGFNPTIFAYPNGDGPDDSKVVNTIAKYYDLARTDTKSTALALLPCGGDGTNVNNQQQRTYCETYLNDGGVIPESKYSINSWAHKHIEETCPGNIADNGNSDNCTNVIRREYDNAQMFQKFVSAVNSQYNYNKDGILRAIPIIVYHTLANYRDLSDSNRPIDTTVNLFDAEMRYLYDNGFKVLTMADIGYDEYSQSLYIKNS